MTVEAWEPHKVSEHKVNVEKNGILQSGIPGAAGLQQMTSLGAEEGQTTLFRTAVLN